MSTVKFAIPTLAPLVSLTRQRREMTTWDASDHPIAFPGIGHTVES